MKKKRIVSVMAMVMVAAMLLAGCEGAKIVSTSVGNKTTIEAKSAPDGTYSEIGPFSVGKGKAAVVESTLDKGALQIDFMEVQVFYNDGQAEDVVNLGVVESVQVGAGESREIPLEKGDYLLQVTTVGETNGKVSVNIG